jgi:hypothetical protein
MEHKLQIEFICFTKRKLPLIDKISLTRKKLLIQTRPFKFGFKIKNIGDTPLGGATLQKIRLLSASGQNITETVDGTFHIDTINPKEEREIWIGEMGTYMHGLSSVHMQTVPDNHGDTIKTFQKNQFTGQVTEYNIINSWLDFFYIYSETEYNQDRANGLLIMTALFTTIVMLINFYYVFKFQIYPEIYAQRKADYEAKQSCQNNPQGDVLLKTGGWIKCSEYMKSK